MNNEPCMDYKDLPKHIRIIGNGLPVTKHKSGGLKPSPFRGNVKRPVIQMDLEGNFVAEFESIEKAVNSGDFLRSGISYCCSGRQKIHNGFKFAFKKCNLTSFRMIEQYDLDGNYIKSFDSLRLAGEETGLSSQNISSCCRGKTTRAGKYIWRFKGEVKS